MILINKHPTNAKCGDDKEVGGEGRLWVEMEVEMSVDLYLQCFVEEGKKMKLKDSESRVCF